MAPKSPDGLLASAGLSSAGFAANGPVEAPNGAAGVDSVLPNKPGLAPGASAGLLPNRPPAGAVPPEAPPLMLNGVALGSDEVVAEPNSPPAFGGFEAPKRFGFDAPGFPKGFGYVMFL